MAEKIVPKQVRGKRLVVNVLEATIVELARVGFENISIESVAERDAGRHRRNSCARRSCV
jgi:hypothetical protein